MTQHNFAHGTVDKSVQGMFAEDLHHMQVLCLALLTFGAVRADRLGAAAVGRAMATGRGTDPKHGMKQVDRFLSNKKLSMEKAWPSLMRTLVGKRDQILVTMDWTDFDADDHTTLVIALVTRSRRAQPLVWKTVRKSTLAKHQSGYERELLVTRRRILPADVRVIVLADRSFGSTALYEHIGGIPGFDFVVRFRACMHVQADSVRAKASTLVPSNGRVKVFHYALLTADRAGPYTVVLYKAAGMKDALLVNDSSHAFRLSRWSRVSSRRAKTESHTSRRTRRGRVGRPKGHRCPSISASRRSAGTFRLGGPRMNSSPGTLNTPWRNGTSFEIGAVASPSLRPVRSATSIRFVEWGRRVRASGQPMTGTPCSD